jgi:hypothetical protein
VIGAWSRRRIGSSKGVTIRVVAPLLLAGIQPARTNPSTRTEPFMIPLLLKRPRCCPAAMIRVRSAWASRMLS